MKKKLIAITALCLMFAMLATSCAKKAEPQVDSSSSSSSESVSAVSEKAESSTSEQPTEESKETSKVSESVPKTTQKKNEQSKQTTSKTTTKPSTTKPKPKPTSPTTTKPAEEKINPAEIQSEINAYIASKGWEVNSSLTPQSAGWSNRYSISYGKSELISRLKEEVNYTEDIASFMMYCYYDGSGFFTILYS